MSDTYHSDRCINPFKKLDERGHKGKYLRKVSKFILERFPDLPKNSKICSQCLKKCGPDKKSDDDPLDESNDSMSYMECTQSSLEMDVDSDDTSCKTEDKDRSSREVELEEMFDGLKQKFSSLKYTDPLRLKILTIAPSNWSIRKIMKEFGTTRYLASKAKKLKSQHGVLADTIAKKGKQLPQETVDQVINFYNSDENSRLMPGRKDVISVTINGQRILQQKRLLLLNLRELYVLFKENYSSYNISFSAFAKLRPKHCILPGASGTHSVCVCTIHQNVKLMIDAINIKKLTKNTNKPLANYKDCLNEIVCKEPGSDCYFDNCDKCPGIDQLLQNLHKLLDESSISHIQFSTWAGTDRSTLLTQTVKLDDFITELNNKLQILKPHSFIAKQQSLFITEKKQNLREDEVIVMFDFSENYSYVVQEASQAFHFNNDQCTVFPVISYFKEHDKLMHKSYVFLTDSLKHDTAAVYSVQTMLIPELKKNIKNLKKIIYITDGAKQHFKNRFQITNLIHHKEDFNIEAEWHYTATAHGKSAYDGIGGTFKREAYRASLTAKPQDAILTSQALYEWAKSNFKKINVFYFRKNYHEKIRRKLNKRFETAQPIPRILINHGFMIDFVNNKVLIKRYSNDKNQIEWSF